MCKEVCRYRRPYELLLQFSSPNAQCLSQRGGALKLWSSRTCGSVVVIPRRHLWNSSKFKQVGKPSVQTCFVAAPERPAEEDKPVEVAQGVDNFVSLTDEQYDVKKEPLAWTKQWYPVGVLNDMDTSKPHLVRLVGGKFVLWCDSRGEWHFQQDRCPHRLAPMSEGKINEDDTLQCSYHGWRFRGDGTCALIPQASVRLQAPGPISAPAGLSAPAGTWPDQCALVPWSHHGVIGNRNKAGTLELKVVEPPSPKGLKVEYFTYMIEGKPNSKDGDKGEPARTQVQFRAPHTLVYDTFRADGSRSKLLSYGIPTKPGECQVFAQIWDTRSSWINKLPLTALTWWLHQVFMKAADGDIMLLKDQEATLPDVPKGWREFHLPTRADVGVRLWREWLERFTNGISCGPYQLASASDHETAALESRTLTKEQLLDRYNGHVEKCPKCLSALKACQKYTWVAGVAAAVFAQLSLLSALNLVGPGAAASAGAAAATLSLGPLSLPLHTVWATVFAGAAAACVKLALTLQSIARSFKMEDYVHAHIH
ncbi:hypothetical protein DUNSADRAFT_17067 [Dunaliella salina]|uniref:Rieske domain-containing protein n=1 Tax=Dunaliella salina TaxID=3046 RepID=A0ABQ7H0I4_DUNSA|nr:hypothetical protein DUNSADRAFT_17067 [Dunaliella salina]|eukprot:KAF5840368.1 hypothetical protein DUNSADRAFT_17067 [Dunaliella salina]